MRYHGPKVARTLNKWSGTMGLIVLFAALLLPFYPSLASAGVSPALGQESQKSRTKVEQTDAGTHATRGTDRGLPNTPESPDQEAEGQLTVLPGACSTFDFQTGTAQGFTVVPVFGTALWHVTNNLCRADLAGHTAPFTFYYGQDGTCNYNDMARNASNLISPTVGFSSPTRASLTFNYLLFVEGGGFDTTFVDISTNGGGTWTQVLSKTGLINDNQWHTVSVDLFPTVGLATSLRARFRFDTIDNLANATTGWHVDDISFCGIPNLQDDSNGNCLTINLSSDTYFFHTAAAGNFTGPVVVTQQGGTLNFTSGPGDPNLLRGAVDVRRKANARIVVPGGRVFTVSDSNIDNNAACP